jgi:tRNA (guanine10-N2)-dimethyltransferase
MQYLAILGRQPEFGLVELESLLGEAAVAPFGRATAITSQKIDLNRLGGSQKLARIIYRGPLRDLNETPLSLDELPTTSGKTTFGLSYYGLQAGNRYVVAAGLTLKKRLRARSGSGSVRFVQPQEGTSLSAAQVKFNGLIGTGFELVVAAQRGQMVIAITEQIQDIDWYAVRDYQRPTRSAKVGMLPPKLAQIMVNTTQAPLVYDPFCGTGVVLQEALLLGRRAGGSDSSAAMVRATTDNLAWLRQQRPDLPTSLPATAADATSLTLPQPPLAIISEGYLGPNLSQSPGTAELATLQRNLSTLYTKSLRHWHSQLPAGAEVSLTAPMWRRGSDWQPLDIVDRLSDLGYTLRSFAHVDPRKLMYHRPQQIVGRQLLLLRKA